MQDTARKALGAFYTEPEVARFLVNWAVRSRCDVVMDPSFGDGVFLEAACRRIAELGGEAHLQVFGIELSKPECSRALLDLGARFGLTDANLRNADFFDVAPLFLSPRVTCMVGNPPFIRYHRFNGRSREKALSCARSAGVHLTELSSSWAPFLVHSASFLAEGGRLAMVVPAELCHASYGLPVLDYLARSFEQITLITFSTRLFLHLNQDTMLLLAEGRGQPLRTMNWKDLPAASSLMLDIRDQCAGLRSLDHEAIRSGRSRLLEYMISPKALSLWRELRTSPGVVALGEIADVGIGYVTGANRYFHLNPEDVARWGIPSGYLKRAVRRGRSLRGIRYTEADWQAGLPSGESCWLLHLPPVPDVQELPPPIRRYTEHGEAVGVHRGYKCRNRRPWYSVPYVTSPDAFLTYMSGDSPRLVTNEAGAVAPNSLHMVRIRSGERSLLPVLWLTSLTDLSCELEGHSLGGGLLKLEPGEAEKVVVPAHVSTGRCTKSILADLARELDALVRQGQAKVAQDLADRAVLMDGIGLSESDCALLRTAAAQLRQRRKER